ncbi:YqaJ viral recombinase family protein [Pseudomonas nitroreducens]|uniref:YqaJ viral recombinase family protein n=1 Tax=Pseudomonas nitroreducens TaxID=46680 RepID=A0ABS0KND1_PSENT|nr:YqaJ viral recombinase family protein [Pseudomonas nitroreducens]MBG6289449.1 YqaJ viral recombinase family protein [Pseudomonas nitroreducens]MDG9857321.1 YqaJ viral recombinase family protein [Pseudomonas nitroreducens]MDH1076585.1 YqaJ viral recombinase family protein [Pseudomonas nitroreducens]
MKVVDLAQRSPEWHEWRREGVSATSCSVIMGANPEKSPLQLWRELVGIVTPPDLSVIPQVRQGVQREPIALHAFEEKYGQLGMPVCGESLEYPIIRASFDGLLANGAPVEIKNLSDENHLEVLRLQMDSPAYLLYRWQVWHQLIVSGASEGYLWFWSPKHEPCCLPVLLDEVTRKRIIEAEMRFWELVETGCPPAADPKRDLIPLEQLDLDAWRKLAEPRRELEQKIVKLKAELKELTNQAKEQDAAFRPLMGTFRRAEALGVRVTSYEIAGAVDWEGVAKELHDAIPDEVLNRHRTGGSVAFRHTVNPNYDEATALPEPKPRVRRLAPADSIEATEPSVAYGTFWF